MFSTYGSMTDEQLVERYSGQPRQSVSGIRTRRKELVDMGAIRDTGTRALMKTNRKAIVWTLA